MDKNATKQFFDRLAPTWDAENRHEATKIEMILDYAGLREGAAVLDIACGTGVLFPWYLRRGARRVVGVDLSPNMLAVARRKFTDPRILLQNADAEQLVLEEKFDCIVVYSAFPHFEHPELLLRNLASALAAGGRLTVAHSESREVIDARHREHAGAVSMGLPPAAELAELLETWCAVDVAMDNAALYVVSGIKRAEEGEK